ncbi:universal stress protein [Rufibacter latericius]|nr:universal stress protein [Rufibacter latericius]
MKTILVPTDFSPNAIHAVHYAASLIQQKGGRLLLVHTLDYTVSVSPEGVPLLPVEAPLIEESEEALDSLAQELRNEFGFRFEVETFCLFGPLIPLLNEQVKTQAVDLVVMGTKGASNYLDRLIGTYTSTYIKEAICPVLVVPAQVSFRPIQHIAYASDLETEETSYLKQLFQLASHLGSEVNIINISSEQTLNIVPDAQILTSIQKHFPQQKYSIAQLKHPDVVAGLKEFVQENHMDVLAVSIQDRDFLESLFHHSVTKQLALKAFVPLLTLPANSYQDLNKRPVPQKAAI